MRKLRMLTGLAAAAILFAAVCAPSAGQGGRDIRVLNVAAAPQAAPDGSPAFGLRATFLPLDGRGNVVSTEIDRAEVRLGNDTYPGTVGKSAGDWTIALLLDASGTMKSDDFKRVATAMGQTLDRAGDNATFTLLRFNDQLTTDQPFTTQKDDLRKRLAAVTNTAGRKPCLNDAALEAVRRVQSMPGRRAVLIATASRDDCGKTTTQAVVDLARQTGVQLFGIGVEGYTVTREELEKYTTPTGGLAITRGSGDVLAAFTGLVPAFQNQWEAAFTMFPGRGKQTADMTVTFKDATTAQTPIAFESASAFTPPPRIAFASEVIPFDGGIRFRLNILNRPRIKRLDVTVKDKAGETVTTQSLESFEESISLNTASLRRGGEYNVSVVARDEQGRELARTEPKAFANVPTQITLNIASVDLPSLDRPTLLVTVSVPSPAGIARFKAYLVDPQSGAVIKGAETIQPPNTLLAIDAARIPSGAFNVRAQALDSANQVLADESKPVPIAYKEPDSVERAAFAVQRNPAAAIGLVVVLALAAIALIAVIRLTRRSQQPQLKPVDMSLPRMARVQVGPDQAMAAGGAAGSETSAGMPLARLTLSEPSGARFDAVLRQSPFTVGRGTENAGRLPLDGSSGVSTRHLTMTYIDGAWYVQDANSANGTFVNGIRLERGGQARVDNGAVIGLGPKVKLVFRTQ